jgi:hypothetical protein
MKSTSSKVSYLILVISLGIAGLLLLFAGWWLPETSVPLQIMGLVWLLLCVATYFVRTKPYFQLATAWLWFASLAWIWWRTTDEHSVVWFLYQNVLSLLILVVSHLVVINIVKKSRIRT